MITIDFVKGVIAFGDTNSSIFSYISKRLINTMLIFLIPTLVFTLIDILDFTSNNSEMCWNYIDEVSVEEVRNIFKTKQEEIEKEQGITFQPELISDKNYFNRIIPDFYQREKIFLEKQQKNIEIYKQYLENEQNNNKKYSQEEKKEIFNNIVTRLYKDGMEKYKEKQGKINYKNDSNDINENYEFKI